MKITITLPPAAAERLARISRLTNRTAESLVVEAVEETTEDFLVNLLKEQGQPNRPLGPYTTVEI